ncbi:MAG: glycosyltransferase family 2 protein [Prevotellaceae bacterium]|nr:glycosyltransferase family 2 protein [Prevotellaceae bacterium]
MEITVIIPVKDRRDYIGKTLDSIMKSSEQPTEIIIVDNESTDGTYQFCEQYIKDIPNATLLRETFPGAAAARNKGLKSCKTDWVYFFDSDDEFDPDFISVLNSLNVDDYDMIAVPTKMQVKGKTIVRNYIPSSDPRVQITAGVLNTQGMVFRTSFLKDIGAWNTECRIWDDWELGLRAILHQPNILWYKERDFHLINVHDDSITSKSFSENYKALIRTLAVALTDLQSSILQPLSSYHAQHLNCIYPHLDQLIYPLYLRTNILLGKMQREKMTYKNKNYKLASKALKIFRNDHFHPTKSQKRVANLLRLYTKYGGRGTWRIALAICQAEHKSR